MIMKPMPGMTGGYSSLNCCLRVEVVSYEEQDEFEFISLRVLKNFNPESGCKYSAGEEFIYPRKKGGDEDDNPLESLILDSV